jgi:hypothetical protein
MATKEISKENVKKSHNIEYARDKGNEKVRGVFKYYEQPGQTARFPFKFFPHDPITVYELTDEHEYEIPLVLAQYINNNCRYPLHKHIEIEKGKHDQILDRYIQRMGFVSTEMFDIPLIQRPGV